MLPVHRIVPALKRLAAWPGWTRNACAECGEWMTRWRNDVVCSDECRQKHTVDEMPAL